MNGPFRISSHRSRLADCLDFARAWAEAPLRTGAIAPSSRALACEMVFAAAPSAKTAVVELGPGTGIVTDVLLECGVDEHNLVLVELNPDFADRLRHRYPAAAVLSENAFAAIPAIAASGREVSAVVSSLPLLVHPHQRRVELVQKALRLTGPRGRFVQFTYNVRAPLRSSQFRAMRSRRVWGNLPPATVWTYQTVPRNSPEPQSTPANHPA